MLDLGHISMILSVPAALIWFAVATARAVPAAGRLKSWLGRTPDLLCVTCLLVLPCLAIGMGASQWQAVHTGSSLAGTLVATLFVLIAVAAALAPKRQ